MFSGLRSGFLLSPPAPRRRRPFPSAKLHRIIECPGVDSFNRGFYNKSQYFYVNSRFPPADRETIFCLGEAGTFMISTHCEIAEKEPKHGYKPGYENVLLEYYNKYYDFGPLFRAARLVDTADAIVEQYKKNANSRLYGLPKVLVEIIVSFIYWDDEIKYNFEYHDDDDSLAPLFGNS